MLVSTFNGQAIKRKPGSLSNFRIYQDSLDVGFEDVGAAEDVRIAPGLVAHMGSTERYTAHGDDAFLTAAVEHGEYFQARTLEAAP